MKHPASNTAVGQTAEFRAPEMRSRLPRTILRVRLEGYRFPPKAARQSDRVAYSGRQVTTLWTRGRAEVTVTQEFHSGTGRTRVETRSPRRARGRLILSDRKRRWQYDPTSHTALRTAASPPADEPADLPRVLQEYTARVRWGHTATGACGR